MAKKTYRCKCGARIVEASKQPPSCVKCAACNTTLANDPRDRAYPIPHDFSDHRGGFKYCARCGAQGDRVKVFDSPFILVSSVNGEVSVKSFQNYYSAFVAADKSGASVDWYICRLIAANSSGNLEAVDGYSVNPADIGLE